VINIASLLAFTGSLPPGPLPFRATYAAAKAYLVTFTTALAAELAGTGVRA
jgi:short-subunit dehydrogenase